MKVRDDKIDDLQVTIVDIISEHKDIRLDEAELMAERITELVNDLIEEDYAE